MSSSLDRSITGRKLAANLFILLTSVYIVSSSGNTIDVTDDGIIRYAVTQRLAERGSFDVHQDIGARWGIRGRDGHYYTNHGLGQSLLAVPFFVVGHWLGNPKFFVSLLGPLSCALSCVILFYFGLRLGYSCWTASTLSLLAGLCTQIWPESKSPFDHNIETLFSFLTVYLVYASFQDGKQKRLLLAGASLGFAALTRITAVFWLLPLAVFFYWATLPEKYSLSWVRNFLRNALFFSFGFLPFLAFIFWYNAFRFGSIWEAGYGLWARQRDVDNFSNPLWIGLLGESCSPGKGVLVYCPILLLPILGLKQFYQWKREVAGFCMLASTLYLIFFAKYVAWHGDIAWGPRYLTFLIPIWVLTAGVILEREDFNFRRHFRVMMKILAIISFLIQLGAVMVDMNLHYFELLRIGAIKDIKTYTYPAKLYFNLQYSPLTDRLHEVVRALSLVKPRDAAKHHTSVMKDEKSPVLDFWWVSNLSHGMSHLAILFLVSPFIFEIVLCGLRIRRLLRQCIDT